jgi:hypothetical protein
MLHRIAEVDPRLNSYATITGELALRQAVLSAGHELALPTPFAVTWLVGSSIFASPSRFLTPGTRSKGARVCLAYASKPVKPSAQLHLRA